MVSKRLGNAITGDLRSWYDHGGEQLKKYSAVTLGLMGDNYGLEKLREMAGKCLNIKENMSMDDIFDGLGAVYLLGELCDNDCVPFWKNQYPGKPHC